MDINVFVFEFCENWCLLIFCVYFFGSFFSSIFFVQTKETKKERELIKSNHKEGIQNKKIKLLAHMIRNYNEKKNCFKVCISINYTKINRCDWVILTHRPTPKLKIGQKIHYGRTESNTKVQLCPEKILKRKANGNARDQMYKGHDIQKAHVYIKYLTKTHSAYENIHESRYIKERYNKVHVNRNMHTSHIFKWYETHKDITLGI